MENKSKILTTGIIGTLSAKLGILVPVLMFLTFAMLVDYTTGMLAAKYEGVIQSRKGMWGIVKKLLYGVAVAVALMVDWTIVNVASELGFIIPTNVFFSVMISVWFIVNECISIIENLIKMEIELPDFLKSIAINFKVAIEKRGNKMAENIKLKDD